MIEKSQIEFNAEVIKVKFDSFNDGIHDTVINITSEQIKTWKSGTCYLKVSVPDNNKSQTYSRKLLNTVVDISKVMNGVSSNVFMKSFVDNFAKSIDFEPKFPLKPVSNRFICFGFSETYFQGTYHYYNLTMEDKYFPMPPNSKFLLELRIVGKIEGYRGNVFILKIAAFFEKR